MTASSAKGCKGEVRKFVEVKKTTADPAFRELMESLNRGERRLTVSGLVGSAKSFVLANLFRNGNKALIVICPTEREAKAFHQDLSFFIGEDNAFLYPPWDILSTDMFSFQREVELARAEIIGRLLCGERIVIVAPLKSAIQRVAPRAVLSAYCETISVGDVLDRDSLAEKLLAGGYIRSALVEEKGEFSLRGNILDIFVPCADGPVRLELMGDELESLRLFDASSQRSIKETDEFTITPARDLILTPDRKLRAVKNIRCRANELELAPSIRNRLVEILNNGFLSSINPIFLPLFYEAMGDNEGSGEGLGDIFEHLPGDCIAIIDDSPAVEHARTDLENQIDRFLSRAAGDEKFFLEKEDSYLAGEDLRERLSGLCRVSLGGLMLGAASDNKSHVRFLSEENERYGPESRAPEGEEGLFARFAEKIRTWEREGNLVTLVCPGQEEVQRAAFLLGQHNLTVTRLQAQTLLDEVERHNAEGRLILVEGRIEKGFRLSRMKLVVVSGEEIFGKKVARRRLRPQREGYFLKSFGELKEGDYVVHTEHGIGLYRGLQKLAVAGIENDYLLIEYQDNDRLYIPVDRLDWIQRYIGPDGYAPKIEKLGGPSWETAKERVKKSIREVAEELVSIYAARDVMERASFSPPDGSYEGFCSTFEFEETPDQTSAIEDINEDMDNEKPMDRLICGDAGFGKTEVALRASFRAAMDGKQVAVLAPTTILAEQHYQTFRRRLNDYPLRIEVLNRMKTKAEQRKIVEGINTGTVDIVIGTHRILQDDIRFRDLGLLVVDEEQRFGVAHKEKLKKLRTLVDVLTLTATPIPRTLHLSLVGIRDLSIINTPPEDRQPVKTYVLEFNEEIIRDAIRQELARDGQVFFLHDRVRSIYTMARFVERLVPEAKVAVVHGQMKAREIEVAMARFIRRERNVLVCTSIVASGLDIPSANTIIINRSDRFGLAQLYQIRGRVGRARDEAYAYLLVPKGAMLSPDARRRLQVIVELSEPGAGFRISSRDLEMRGAGNILGISQSGHISAVGYELYTELMEKTIREIKGEIPPEEEVKPEINLGLPAFIPEAYMADVQRRLVTYKRISMAADPEDLRRIREELVDCYGPPPDEVDDLLAVIDIRNELKRIMVKKMVYDGKTLLLSFHENSPVDPARLVELSRREIKGMKFSPDLRLTVPMPNLGREDIIGQARRLLQMINGQ